MVTQYIGNQKRYGISGSTLKLIAVTAMLLDHIGVILLEPMIMRQMATDNNVGMIAESGLYWIHYVFRMVIGRSAFPIFCFLLTEGMQKSKNHSRYLLRMLGFALLSEPVFDLTITGKLWNPSWQNVYLTLFIGLGTMMAVEWLLARCRRRLLRGLVWGCGLLLGMGMAEVLHSDYGGYGVLCILTLYFFRRDRKIQLLSGVAVFPMGELLCYGRLTELMAPLGLLPVAAYNGERGWRVKYLFYLFYPLHLLILYGIRRVINI